MGEKYSSSLSACADFPRVDGHSSGLLYLWGLADSNYTPFAPCRDVAWNWSFAIAIVEMNECCFRQVSTRRSINSVLNQKTFLTGALSKWATPHWLSSKLLIFIEKHRCILREKKKKKSHHYWRTLTLPVRTEGHRDF